MELYSWDFDDGKVETIDKNNNIVAYHGKWYWVNGEYGGGYTTKREATQCYHRVLKAYGKEGKDDALSVFLMNTDKRKPSMIALC